MSLFKSRMKTAVVNDTPAPTIKLKYGCPYHPTIASMLISCGSCDTIDYYCPEKYCGYGSGHAHGPTDVEIRVFG